MYTSLKRTFILVLMFLIIFGISAFASKYNLQDTEISFENGIKIALTTSKNINVDNVLKENNISVLGHEKVEEKFQNGKRVIKIVSDNSKKDIVTSFTLSENSNIKEIINNKIYNNLTEKIEVVEVEIPFNTVTKNLATNSADTTSKIVKEGKNGKKEITSRNTYVNNKLVDSVEISSKILEEPIDKIIQVSAKSISRSGASVTRSNNRYNYSDSEIDLLCAITAQECSTSYEGALAVITTAMNRASSSEWQKYGKDPLSQYKAKNQFTYSIDGQYRKRLNGNYKSFVKQAVLDALNGKRNHNYLSFNSVSTGRSGKIIGDNVYF